MKSTHIKTRKVKNDRQEIEYMYKLITNDYICNFNDGNLNIQNEKLFINSQKDKYNNPLMTGAVASVLGVVVGIILNPMFDMFKKISTSNIIAFLIVLVFLIVFIGIILGFYYLFIIKDIFKFYKSYLKKNTYYSICLDVLNELEKRKS